MRKCNRCKKMAKTNSYSIKTVVREWTLCNKCCVHFLSSILMLPGMTTKFIEFVEKYEK